MTIATDTVQNISLGRYQDEVVVQIGMAAVRLEPLAVVGLIKGLAAICEDIVTRPTPPPALITPEPQRII